MPLQEHLFRQDTFYVLRCFGGKNVSGWIHAKSKHMMLAPYLPKPLMLSVACRVKKYTNLCPTW